MNHHKQKDQAVYWENRLIQRERKGKKDSPWYASIQHAGKRRQFNLGSNKVKAAKKAAELYRTLRDSGWEAVYDKNREAEMTGSGEITVGQFLEKVLPLVESDRSKSDYAMALRRLAREIKGLPEYDHGDPEASTYAVDRLPLAILNPDALEVWKLSCMSKAGDSPLVKEKADKLVKRTMKNAKSLFGPKRLKGAGLPHLESPFIGSTSYNVQTQPYRSRFKAYGLGLPEMLREAKKEWGGIEAKNEIHREAYKALILFSFAALRKQEVDLLPWSCFCPASGTIEIRATNFFKPKAGSAGLVKIGAPATMALTKYRAMSPDDEFILKGKPPRVGLKYAWYRSDKTLKFLARWIKDFEWEGCHPFSDVQKPLHELRKEKGAQIVTEHRAILPASKFLRHKNTMVTEMHYADYLEEVTGDIEGISL